jgi:hypothetical protein
MTKAIILVDGSFRGTSPAVVALERAARLDESISVEVLSTTAIASSPEVMGSEIIYCPLTLDLPDNFEFPARGIYQACQDIVGTREWVEAKLGYRTGEGNFWLPVVLTAKGPLYGEVIGPGEKPESYQQPVHLTDDLRQPLYHLAYKSIHHWDAPPGVYLLQFNWQEQEIIFDRLLPFPAVPAIASLGLQQPDLFTCHWLCLAGQPILDLTIC